MSKKLDRFLKKKLEHNKNSKLSFFEKFALKKIAMLDSLYGLPRQDESGVWTSPSIQFEINLYNEKHKKIYGFFHIEMEEKIKELPKLMDKMKNLNAKILEMMKLLPSALSEEEKHTRKAGEETIDEDVIVLRRIREIENERRKIQEKMEPIQKERDLLFDSIIELKNDLDEKYLQIKIICERLRIKTQLKIDYYWAIAYRSLYNKDIIIPTNYTQIPVPDVIIEFKALQESMNQSVEEVISLYQNVKEAA